MKIGHIRVSTQEQNTTRQEVLMQEPGVDEVELDGPVRGNEFGILG